MSRMTEWWKSQPYYPSTSSYYSTPSYTQPSTPPAYNTRRRTDTGDGCLRITSQVRYELHNRVIIGNHNTLTGTGLIVYGDYNTVTDSSTAVTGKRNEVYGNGNKVTGHCLVSGDRNRVNGQNCVVKGSSNIVNGVFHVDSDCLSSPSSEIGFFHADEDAAIDTVNNVGGAAVQPRRSRRLASKRNRHKDRGRWKHRSHYVYNEVDASSSTSEDDEYDVQAFQYIAAAPPDDVDEDDDDNDSVVDINATDSSAYDPVYPDQPDTFDTSDNPASLYLGYQPLSDTELDVDARHDYYI